MIGWVRTPGAATLLAPGALPFLLFLLFWDPTAVRTRSINRKNSKNSKGYGGSGPVELLCNSALVGGRDQSSAGTE